MKKLLVCLLIFSNLLAYAQEALEENVIPPSPDAAKLAQFGITPTNLYTGAHNLSIPLHTIDFDGMALPISISYHSGGVRVGEDASWIGLGWALSTTGVVSRTVRGYDDLMNDAFHKGYVYASSIPETICFGDPYFTSLTNAPDTQPDIFTYSFFGNSGKFVLSKKHETGGVIEVIKLSEDPNRIEFDETNRIFTITTPTGHKGSFSIEEYTTNVSGNNTTAFGGVTMDKWDACQQGNIDILEISRAGNLRATTSWYLSTITSPRNKTIDFTYDLNVSGLSEYVSISPASFAENQSYWGPDGGGNNLYVSSCSKMIHEHVNIKEISSTDLGIDIQFNTADRDDLKVNDLFVGAPFGTTYFPQANDLKNLQRLTGIDITNTLVNSTLNKSVTFGQTYFNDGAQVFSNSHRFLRLKLNDITIDDQLYSFEYFDGLPDKTTNGQDYWGFYNGKNANTRLLPANLLNVSIFAVCESPLSQFAYFQTDDRKANFTYGKGGLLHTVTYPTKGSTEYSYEAHDYKLSDNEIVPSGGSGDYAADASQGDITETFSYTGFLTAGGQCNGYVNLKMRVQCREFFLGSSCTIAGVDYAKTAVEIINNETGHQHTSLTYSFLAGLGVNEYEQNLALSLPPGSYTLKAYGIKDGNGVTKYYGSASVNFIDICDDTPQPPGSIVTHNQLAGGARIAAITNYDSNGEFVEKRSYEYKDESISAFSSGTLTTPLRNIYQWGLFNSSSPCNTTASSTGSGFPTCATILSSNSAISGVNGSLGSHIGYSHVREFFEDSQGNNIGFKQYNYHNFPNSILLFADVAYSHSNINGQLLSELVLNNTNDVQQQSSFDNFYDNLGTVSALKYKRSGNNNTMLAHYSLPVQFVAPKQAIVQEFFLGSKISTTTTSEYNDNFLLKKQTTTNSEGETLEVKYKRPSDYTSPSGVVAQMITDHVIGPVVEQITTNNGQVTNAVATKFENANGMTHPKEVHIYNTDAGSFAESSDGLNFNSYEPRASYQYDNAGNIKRFNKIGDVNTIYIWGYNETLPVAMIVNGTMADLITVMGTNYHAGTGALSPTEENNLRSAPEFANALITTYTHNPGVGIASVTDPNGLTMQYYYDSEGRLQYTKNQEGKILARYDYNYKQ